MQPDLAQLDALSRAVSEGTFEAAARALHVTPSAVSQRIKALERTTGQILLSREKPVRPTAAGESLLRLAVQVRALVDDAARELGGGGSDASATPGAPAVPVVPLAVNADSLATWVLPALAGVRSPAVFDLHRDDQEHTVELLRRGTVMAAITSSPDAVAGCTVERLGTMRYRPLASPAFVRRWFADGPTPAALGLAPVVVFDRSDALQDRYLRRRRVRANPPRQHVPASADFHEAVRLGLGWGMLPDQQAAAELRDGSLVELETGAVVDVRLHWQQWRIHSTLLGEVADAIRQAAGATLTGVPRRQRGTVSSRSSSPA